MIKRFVLIAIGIYILCLIGIYFFQEKIIFRAKNLSKNHVYTIDANFEEINLKANDEVTLNALYFKVDNPKGVILYFHGNKGNLERWSHKIKPLLNYDYNLFMIDYRGYGKNDGERTEKYMYSDAQLAYDFLLDKFEEDQIVVYGRSLGGTFATYVASKNKPKHLILEATFNNILDVSKKLIPIFPFKKLYRFNFNSDELIKNVTVPTTIFHGDLDSLVPLLLAQKLYLNSNKKTSELIIIDKGTHHNLSESIIYKNKVKKILQ